MTRDALRRFMLERGGLLAFVALVVYVWLAPHHAVDGDNSEFATLSVTGGAAHPSGYPLYILWLRATSWLPLGEPAHTAAIATSILGALTVLVLHAVCRAWGASSLSATCAAALFATGPVVLRVSTEAEVFALNNLVVAVVLWIAAQHGPVRGRKRALLLGLVAGLGLANHLTCALVAPIGVLGIVRAAREQDGGLGRAFAHAIGWAVAGLVVGLLPYAYLFVAPSTPMSWGTVRSADELVALVLRRDYGGPTAFRVSPQGVSMGANELALLRTLARGWLWIPLAAGLAALAWSVARERDGDREPRVGWGMLALAWLVAGPLLVARFNVPPRGLGLYVNQRFHVLPLLLLAPAVARAFDIVRLRRHCRLATALVASLGFVILASTSLGYLGGVHSPAVEVGAKNMLRTLPPNAVVIHSQDELHAVPAYVQWVLGERQDVTIVTWSLTPLPWYRDRLAAQGVLFDPSRSSELALVRDLLAAGRPVFVDRLQRAVIEQFPTYPYGVLIRVEPRGAQLPSLQQVFALNEDLFARFALDYPRPTPHDEFATEVHKRYSATWDMIGKMLERAGDHTLAARAFEHARALAPLEQ